MPPRFSSILSSKPFEIKSSDRSYFIHGNIFAERWESFRSAAIDEGGIIDLSDWDSDTVGLFAEFLYTGDYQTSQRTPEGSEAEEGQERNGVNLLETAQSLAARQDWRFGGVGVNLLLVHAKLYALAQDRDVQPLREIAFGRFREALERIDTATLGETSRAAVNVIELLLYVYTYTDISSPLVGPETPMRDLVSKFAVENIEKLMGRKREMKVLLSKGGDFMVGLMGGVVARLCHAEMYCDEQRYRDMEKEVQDWQEKAATSDGRVRQIAAINAKIRQSESSNAEKVRQLEEQIRQSEATNSANERQTDIINTTKIRQLEATYKERIRQLNVANITEIRQLGATHEERIRELEATYKERVRQLGATHEERTRELEATYKERIRRFDVANSAEIQQLEATYEERIQGLEATYKKRIRRLNTTNSAEIQQLATTCEERIQQLDFANNAEIQQLNATNTRKIRDILTAATIFCLITATSVLVIAFVALQSKYSRAH